MKAQFLKSLLAIIGIVTFTTCATEATTSEANHPAGNLTAGWRQIPLKFQIQKPYDLDVKDRYYFDPAGNIHDFWVYFTDKPHDPPPNKTTARTEMRLESFKTGERMFDADVNISPGTFACIAQVFDAPHGPVMMIIAHPDGTVTAGNHDVIMTNAIGKWWNLKVSNDAVENGQIKIYVNGVLAATYKNHGLTEYYFKCGVYSRKNSQRSEAKFRNIKVWEKPDSQATSGGK